MSLRTFPTVLALLLVLIFSVNSLEICGELEDSLPSKVAQVFQNPIHRMVDPVNGSNIPECLNPMNSSGAPPCKTLQYGVHGFEEPQNRSILTDLVITIAPGTYVLIGALQILDSERVALIGAGMDSTFFNCGESGESDSACSYMNFQIRNSSYVHISRITFTRCGPITSSVYVAESEFVFFDSCAWRDNDSPSVLLYNTPQVSFTNSEFTVNQPQNLSVNVSRSTCYFSGGQDVFFLDNRTSAGGISFYHEDSPVDMFISNVTFRNNSARPDVDVSLPRASEAYGHGGAINIRLLHSDEGRMCIQDSIFEENFAEAFGGAIAIAAGFARDNKILIQNSTFTDNYCQISRCAAGAIGIDIFSDTSSNRIFITETNFTGNKAQTGGAITLSTSVGQERVAGELLLRNCRFEENVAFYEGTALGLFSLSHADQIGAPINVTDCIFARNVGSQGSADTTAVTAYRVLISFTGDTTFVDNRGGGITLLSSRMEIKGAVKFENNSAVFGAGVAISGRSLLLLYSGASLLFLNNVATEEGAGIYVEYASSDFVLAVLNRGCFLQYFSEFVDIPPDEWNATIEFINNTAGLAGAAIYANDMSRCKWLGPSGVNLTQEYFIFQSPPNYTSPFKMSNNQVILADQDMGDFVSNKDLGTDASTFSATTDFNISTSTISYGESVSFRLSSLDQLKNFRQSVWSVNVPLEPQPLGALSSNNTLFVYDVPALNDLATVVDVDVNGTANITAAFSLLGSLADPFSVPLLVDACHPGYKFDNDSQQCQCQDQLSDIIRCDSFDRYFFVRDGLWVGVREDNTPFFSTTVPGFLNCTGQGSLPGCLVKFDFPDEQCAPGRKGALCGDCEEGYGVTFDLRFCNSNCGAGGIVLFVVICIATLIVSLLVLYYDFPLPNELRGVIFFAQVIGVIYRNTPYLLRSQGSGYDFFDFLINMLGFAMPFPVCLWENIPAVGVAILGFLPPVIATLTAVFYVIGASKVRFLSQRTAYGFHGFYFLSFFIYKYLLDTSFIFVSCTRLNSESVFIYQGSFKCFNFPFIILFLLGLLLLLILGVILPAYTLLRLYQPKALQFSDALTHGFKKRRRYRWYGVWDIWRRLLFVAANLCIAVTTTSVVLFIHCILILICLTVVCAVKPYKKAHVNVLEALMIMALFGATLSILDEQDIYVGPTTSIFFIAFPFLYGALFILYKLFMYLWHKADKKWMQSAWLMETMKPIADSVKPVLQRVLPMKMMSGDEKEEEKPEELQEKAAENEEDQECSQFREPLLEENPSAL